MKKSLEGWLRNLHRSARANQGQLIREFSKIVVQIIEEGKREGSIQAGREDILGATAFLASDEAGFISGQTLSVSGSLTMC